jgi:hypothetical protein
MIAQFVNLDRLLKKRVQKGEKGHENEKKGNQPHLLVKLHQILLNAF